MFYIFLNLRVALHASYSFVRPFGVMIPHVPVRSAIYCIHTDQWACGREVELCVEIDSLGAGLFSHNNQQAMNQRGT